ncbi:hypothetical protein [uncultured Kocuria sp.]|uniref:hypothetical protein n=1 Tax=uncultured Kocuria sp. TaxID=259305 RepID=UPI002629A618|nr:hypothetical protein [uncultured Kocuria sp.]
MRSTANASALDQAVSRLLPDRGGRGLLPWFLVASIVLMAAVLEFPRTAVLVAAVATFALAVKFMGRSLVSPVLLVSGGLLIVAVAGYFLYPALEDVPHAAGIRMPADPERITTGFWALIYASFATSTGALAVMPWVKQPTGRLRIGNLHMRPRIRALLVLATAVPTMMLIATRGLDSLLERRSYLAEGSAGGFGGALSLAGIVSMAICGYLLHTQRSLTWLLVLLNVLMFTTLMISTGSRRFAAIPVLLAIGYYVARHDKISGRLLALGVLGALLLVPLPLYWRTLDTHGLFPYLNSLGDYLGSDLGLGTAAKTVLISVPLIGTAVTTRLPSEALITSLDPRPGESAGWYDIAQSMRLNAFTPTPGVGELLHHGTLTLVVFFLLVGLYLSLLDRHLQVLTSRGHQLIAFAHIGLTALFLLYVIQYNLRSSVRMLYYSLALLAAYTLWRYAVWLLLPARPYHSPYQYKSKNLPAVRLNTSS